MKKETDGKGNTFYKYVKCPACGSKKRHYEEGSKKAIEMGVAKPGTLMPYQYDNQIMGDPALVASAPIGTEIPSITTALEVCKDCGCVYAPMVITSKVKKQLATPAQQAKKDDKPKLYLPGDR